MAFSYCPISRTFFRLRRELMAELDLPRNAIRPSTRMDLRIPGGKWQAVLKRWHEAGLRVPGLSLYDPGYWKGVAVVVGATALLAVLFPCNLWAYFLAPPLIGFLYVMTTQPWAFHFIDGSLTFWDAALYLTPYRECREAGYRLSKRELSAKVRIIISENMGFPPDQVTPESRFVEDLGA